MLIDKLAWLYIREGKILSTRSYGRSKYYIPGGKREKNETDIQALKREIHEELNINLIDDTLQFYGIFQAQADNHMQGVQVNMTCYFGEYTGTIKPSTEIKEVVWLNFSELEMISEVDKLIFKQLEDEGILY